MTRLEACILLVSHWLGGLERHMNAREYLQFHERVYGSGGGSEESESSRYMAERQYMARLRAQQFGDSSPEAEAIPSIAQTAIPKTVIADYILLPILNSLPTYTRRILEEVPLGVLPIRAVNGHTVRAPNGDPLIILNRGLFHMASFYIETQLSLDYIQEQVRG
jgi:hypothetical protein